MLYDLPLEQLRVHKPERIEPQDSDAFWNKSIEDAQNFDLNAQFSKVDYKLDLLETFDVTFCGYAGQPI
jgi:cephalosporin-C deacetylase